MRTENTIYSPPRSSTLQRHEGTMPLHSSLDNEYCRPVSHYLPAKRNDRVCISTTSLTTNSPLQTKHSLFSNRVQLNLLAISAAPDRETKLSLINHFAKRKFNRSKIATSYHGLNFARMSYTSPNGEVCDVKVFETTIDLKSSKHRLP